MARMRSPSWPPKESSTMLDQSSSPDAHRYTDGMNPVEISTGIGRRYTRCASRDAVGHQRHLSELALEPGVLAEKQPRHGAVARPRLLDETGQERGDLGQGRIVEDAALDGLGDQQLVVVAEAGDELSLRQELAVLDGAETLEHADDVQELLPVRVPQRVERLALLREAAIHAFGLLPLLVAPRLGAPGTAMARLGGERRLRPVAPLSLDEIGQVEARQLFGETVRASLPVARQVERRRLPEHALDVALLQLDGAAVRQQHLHQRAVTPRIHSADEAERGAALPAHQGEPAWLGLGYVSFPADRRVRASCAPLRDPRAAFRYRPIREKSPHGAANPRALSSAAVRLVHLGLERADLLQVLVLAEGGFHRAPDRRQVLARPQQQGRAEP